MGKTTFEEWKSYIIDQRSFQDEGEIWPVGHILKGDEHRAVDRLVREFGEPRAQKLLQDHHKYDIEVIRVDVPEIHPDASPLARGFMFHFGGDIGSVHFCIGDCVETNFNLSNVDTFYDPEIILDEHDSQ